MHSVFGSEAEVRAVGPLVKVPQEAPAAIGSEHLVAHAQHAAATEGSLDR